LDWNDGETVYQGRNFYRIDYSYAEGVLLDLISQPAKAPWCGTEKGSRDEIAAIKKAKTTTFPAQSLFRAIVDRRIDLPFQEEVLICADLGTECADFVAANFAERKLALIHALECLPRHFTRLLLRRRRTLSTSRGRQGSQKG
jgi:hypothetical protein